MSPRPVIFVSAVSDELSSARQFVANALRMLRPTAEWQEISETETDDLRPRMRNRIDGSKGVVQLVGNCYGPEPPDIDEEFGRVSYTQSEALYAASQGKKVWHLFLDEGFPTDPHKDEDVERQKLQNDYRDRVKAAARKLLGPEHPDTNEYEQLLQELLAKEG